MISIIVPVYNTEKYLKKCLDSLVNQTYENIEIIVVNDGSPDDSDSIIKEYERKYPKLVKGYTKKNGGLSDARNYGIKKCKGDYVAFVDSDDWVELNMFEVMHNYLINNNYDLVVCDTFMEYENYNTVLKSNLHYSDDDIKNYIISYPMAWIRLFKRDLFKDDYYFTKGILYEDLCLTPLFVNQNIKIGFCEIPMYHYLQRDGSIMNQLEFNDKLYDIIKVLNHVYDEFSVNNNLDKYHDEVEYLYITHLLRSTTLRFLNYKDGKNKLKNINEILVDKFPDWKKNIYFKKSSMKLKLVCYLAIHRMYCLVNVLNKIKK